MINFYNAVFPLLIFLVAYITTLLLMKIVGVPTEMNRQTSLDGLRGIAALGVFICHAGVWHHYIHTGVYDVPGPGVSAQLANSCVFIFFMITGFLFMSKLIREGEKGVNWIRIYVSRFLRIVPLYLFAMLVMFSLVAFETDFQLRTSPESLLIDVVKWLTFTTFGEANVNGYQETSFILSHVQWTLVYEWLFYFSLPLLAWVMRLRTALLPVVLSAVLVCFMAMNMIGLFLPRAFLVGIFAAIIYTNPKVRLILLHPFFTVLAVALILWQGLNYPEATYTQPTLIPSMCLAIAFIIIANGNNMFGLLSSRGLRYLGEVSYGVYLLHGIVLFCVFKYLIGIDQAQLLSPLYYWLTIVPITILVLLAATLSYQFIEAPAMKKVSAVSEMISKLGKYQLTWLFKRRMSGYKQKAYHYERRRAPRIGQTQSSH